MPKRPIIPIKLNDEHLSAQPWKDLCLWDDIELDLYEAAEILGVSRSSVYRYCSTGQLPYYNSGRKIRICPKELRRFVDRYFYDLQN